MNGPTELHGVQHIMRQLQPERTCEQGCAGCDDCTDFDDGGECVGQRCAGCSAPLTADELNFYGATCERCEGKAFHAQQEADQVPDTGKKVAHLGQRRHDLARLVADIKATVYAHSGQISTVEAIGALELAKYEIIGEQL